MTSPSQERWGGRSGFFVSRGPLTATERGMNCDTLTHPWIDLAYLDEGELGARASGGRSGAFVTKLS